MADLTPQERERIFLEEKARLEARKNLESKSVKAKTNSVAVFGFAVLAIPVAIWVLTAVTGRIASSIPVSEEQKKRLELHGPRPDIYELKARVETSLMKTARDPDSVKIYEWSEIFFNDKDGWIIKADWGAKNGFGGMTRQTNWFVMSKKGYTVKPGDAYK